MGAPVKVRVSYMADMRYLIRLKEAVEIDVNRPAKFRTQAAGLLSQLIDLLNRAPMIDAK